MLKIIKKIRATLILGVLVSFCLGQILLLAQTALAENVGRTQREQEHMQIAFERVEGAIKNNRSTLTLRGLRIDQLPSNAAETKSLKRVDLTGTKISDLSPLSNNRIENLRISEDAFQNAAQLSRWADSLDVLWVDFHYDFSVEEFLFETDFPDFSKLRILGFNYSQITDFTFLSKSETLELLAINASDPLQVELYEGKFPGATKTLAATIPKLSQLRRLRVSASLFPDISPISGNQNLEHLQLTRYRGLFPTLSGLEALQTTPNVEMLSLEGGLVKSGFEYIAGLDKLWALDIRPWYNLKNMDDYVAPSLDPLAKSQSISALGLYGYAVKDLTAVSKIHSLEALDIEGVPLRDISVLSNLPNLKDLNFKRVPVRMTPAMKEFMEDMDARKVRLEY
ncbi:leucine-rich repeat domain-containing protein [Flexibacterium corallicola]|uniref:hypothetical protein n=1 Tax=Flexibacterium corallicola TaxID=3037259 RepID=UPI00286EF52E|nr:hypothetical protein [Pseudovibrio sp. M1P-2-3]